MKHNQNKKILIFDDKLSGHNLEYLHHLYTGAVQDKTNNYICFENSKQKVNYDGTKPTI